MQQQTFHRPYPQQQPPPPSTSQQQPRAAYSSGQRRAGPGPMMSSGPHHHQVPVNPAQVAQQQQQQAMQLEMAKRRSRKPTDKNLPDDLELCTIGDMAARYQQLREFERRLDATMTRKRLDIVDSASRTNKCHRTLRIWISNTAHDQVWQAGPAADSFDFSSSSEPSYHVKIEGRLLDDADEDAGNDDQKSDDPDRMEEDGDAKSAAPSKAPRHRLSHFFKSINVDFPPNHKASGRPVEWKKPERPGPPSSQSSAAADFDELTFRRPGDENVNVVIHLNRHQDPERYAISPELQDIIDLGEATRQEAVMGIWEYIKFMGLQEDEEKRNFRCDDVLKKAFHMESGHISKLHEYITQHIRPLPPVAIPYTIRVDEAFHKDAQPTVFDVRVEVEDLLREKMVSFLNNPGYASMLREAAALDDQLATIVQAIHVSKAKHSFLTSLGDNPATFVKNWLSSQKRDLEIIMGEAMRGGGEDTSGDQWRKGGRDSVWATDNARESVNVMMSKQPFVPPRP